MIVSLAKALQLTGLLTLGAFGNPLIATLLSQQWFSKSTAEGVGAFSTQFNPPTINNVALITTTIGCGLDGWKEGILSGGGVPFSQDDYEGQFQEHLESLKRFRRQNPAKFKATFSKLWKDAWGMARLEIPTETTKTGLLDDDDFADTEDEAEVSEGHAAEHIAGGAAVAIAGDEGNRPASPT
ncbi:hypothetical protein FA95DRAFT_1576870 [Auriscalpium vulgare]|uniref:Uncharacterized protein n=1 Tax=Auriscalpium vulgare TaxID=40419 RepID=A0ACB8R927_9AGAM|nr:hypothetical protein FA95DRAFT_1576870 [Auriscalpium vulgare]